METKMVKDKLKKIITQVKSDLEKEDFKERGKGGYFVRKYKSDYMREEKISFTARQHGNDKDAIYIGCTAGIYYPTVRKIYQCMVNDHLSKYPIVAGSISHFSDKNELMSICYKEGINEDEVVFNIKSEIQNGAFNLFRTFPTLEELYKGIEDKHPFLSDFYAKNITIETQIEIASIIYIIKGLSSSINWMQENIQNIDVKNQLICRIMELNIINSNANKM